MREDHVNVTEIRHPPLHGGRRQSEGVGACYEYRPLGRQSGMPGIEVRPVNDPTVPASPYPALGPFHPTASNKRTSPEVEITNVVDDFVNKFLGESFHYYPAVGTTEFAVGGCCVAISVDGVDGTDATAPVIWF